MIGKALLPISTTSQSGLPAPVESITETPPTPTVEEVNAVAVQTEDNVVTPPEVNAVAVQTEDNVVTPPEVKVESAPALTRSLSPYPYVSSAFRFIFSPEITKFGLLTERNDFFFLQYPDFKPPSSPSPSRP